MSSTCSTGPNPLGAGDRSGRVSARRLHVGDGRSAPGAVLSPAPLWLVNGANTETCMSDRVLRYWQMALIPGAPEPSSLVTSTSCILGVAVVVDVAAIAVTAAVVVADVELLLHDTASIESAITTRAVRARNMATLVADDVGLSRCLNAALSSITPPGQRPSGQRPSGQRPSGQRQPTHDVSNGAAVGRTVRPGSGVPTSLAAACSMPRSRT